MRFGARTFMQLRGLHVRHCGAPHRQQWDDKHRARPTLLVRKRGNSKCCSGTLQRQLTRPKRRDAGQLRKCARKPKGTLSSSTLSQLDRMRLLIALKSATGAK